MLSAQSSNRLQSATADSSAIALWQMMEQSGLRALALAAGSCCRLYRRHGRWRLSASAGGNGCLNGERWAPLPQLICVITTRISPNVPVSCRWGRNQRTIDAANLEALRREIA